MIDDLFDASGPQYAKAMGHPARHRLLLELGQEGATISQLANRMLSNKGSISYHLNVLVQAGLARRDRTRTVRGGTEQYYVRTARRYRFEDSPGGLAAMMSNLNGELGNDPDALINYRVLRLTRAQAAALATHLDSIVNDLRPAGEREPQHGVVVSVYQRRPTVPRQARTEDQNLAEAYDDQTQWDRSVRSAQGSAIEPTGRGSGDPARPRLDQQ